MNHKLLICFLLITPSIVFAKPQTDSVVKLQDVPKLEKEVPSDKLTVGVTEEEKPELKSSRTSRKRVASLNDALDCGLDVSCFLENLQVVLDDRKQIMLAEADARYMSSNLARATSNEPPSELAQTVEGIINKMSEIVRDTVSSWLKNVKFDDSAEEINETDSDLEEEKDDENQDITEEGRGKKKKKLKSLIKLLILGAVLKAKLTVLLQLLSAALQIKFFFIALTGLLINKIRLWYDLKKSHHPQKVIYYEHAQHQHHYDHLEDDHHGGGGFWGRAYEIPESEEEGLAASSQELAYRGQDFPYRGQDYPYRAQRPIPWQGGYYGERN